MREIVGATAEETKLIKAIQKKMGILDNGIIGTDTMTSIAQRLGADCFPISAKMYGCPTVISKTCLPFDPNGSIANFSYTMSGSFTWPRNEVPCSICIGGGKVLQQYACHYWQDGKPESVIFETTDGKFGIKRCMTIAQLQNVKWAVGGMGLLNSFDPVAEGFTGANADVLRKTGHTVLGYKNGYLYGICFNNHTTEEINKILKNKFMLEAAIQLDGGSIYYYNFPDFKKNINYKCGYAIQFVKG